MNKKVDNQETEDEVEQDLTTNQPHFEDLGEEMEQAGLSDDEDLYDSLKEENQHLKEEYLRALADAENTKKRCAQEIEKNSKYAISSFAKSLLSVADNLHRAIAAAANNNAEGCKDLLIGVEMTEAELMKILGTQGITKMELLETIFDPNFHQVVQEVEDPSKPAGTIIAELQTGYMINDRLLREAMVVVTKGGK